VQSFPGVTCATPYGATEPGGTALVAFGDDCVRPGAVLGRPLLGMVAAVLDDNDEPVPHGQVGELCFRGGDDAWIGTCRMHLPRCCATAGCTPATSVEKIATG
jgi:acyl-coenzyme A synthetase/AMP-(fatty) acid ligase